LVAALLNHARDGVLTRADEVRLNRLPGNTIDEYVVEQRVAQRD
jgi:hypothetical protein